MDPTFQIGPLDPFWRHFIDICVSVLVLRIMLGWLVTYRRLVQFVFLAVALVALGWAVFRFDLPLAQILGIILIVPLLILLTLSIVPEFRRIYEAANVGRLFAVPASRREETLSTMVDTVRHLAENRCGAILVFPQKDNIANFCQGGEPVDARVGKSLLLSILNPRCPRHDGAVIIEGERITRIGAVLPLASAEGVDPNWGTRHLAALGLCQASDAEVLAISEERGTISHGKAGRLVVVDTSDERPLRRIVADALHLEINRKRMGWRLLGSLGLWTLAIVIGVVGSLNFENVRDRLFPQPNVILSAAAPIVFTGLTNSLFIAQQSHTEATITLQVPEERSSPLINFSIENLYRSRFDLDRVKITIDLARATAGAQDFPLTAEMIGELPEKWEVEGFKPDKIHLLLASILQTEAQVEPRLSDTPKGLRVKGIKVVPDNVHVEVRDPQWNKERKIPTELIDISHVSLLPPPAPAAPGALTNGAPQPPPAPEPTEGEFTFAAKLDLPPGVKLMEPGKDVVRVTITLAKSRR